MKAILILASLLFLGACQTIATSPRITQMISSPPGALITVDGLGQCETPCTVEFDTTRSVTVAKAGYSKQTFWVKPGKRQIKIELELAAASDNVEETGLPDL